MGAVLDHGKQYLEGSLLGDGAALSSLFNARLSVWSEPLVSEEFFTYSLFGDLEQSVEPHVAFSLIEAGVRIAIDQTDKNKIDCALWLLLALVEASQTTEVPAALKRSYLELYTRAEPFGMPVLGTLLAIQGHYRNAL